VSQQLPLAIIGVMTLSIETRYFSLMTAEKARKRRSEACVVPRPAQVKSKQAQRGGWEGTL